MQIVAPVVLITPVVRPVVNVSNAVTLRSNRVPRVAMLVVRNAEYYFSFLNTVKK